MELKNAKENFYKRKIRNLRKSNPRNWHRELKKITNYDKKKSENLEVEEIKDLPEKEQAEKIADRFSAVSQEYEKLRNEDIEVPPFSTEQIPKSEEHEVQEVLEKMETNKSDVQGDIPAKILKLCSALLTKPITDIINSSIRKGVWPEIFKMEIVTPVPKKKPTKTMDQLRNISGLLNLSKIAEKLISKLIIADMKNNLDPSQYANQPGLSIQHYLVKFIDRILESLDKSSKKESCAILATLVDWKQAFPRQCPKLGVQSFLKNGVRPSLIPVLISYFQGRKMKVKWHGQLSSSRNLNGGGPQGSTFGIWEYLAQSNDNCQGISEEDKFKFVDDLSFIEIIYLLNVGMASYNLHSHIPTDIPTHNQLVPKENLRSQEIINQISDWTTKQKMKLNESKSQNMIFNFSKTKQFTTNLKMNNTRLEVVDECKLLGTILTKDLTWNRNTTELVKNGFKRMQLLYKAASFTKSKQDLKSIYLTYIRSALEQSAVVWHSSLSKKNRNELERVQKAAVKVILGNKYISYKDGLKTLNIQTLDDRREVLCLSFAKKCLKNEKVKSLFPLKKSEHNMKIRKTNKFKTERANTKRYEKSAVPYMRRLLNKEWKNLQESLKT